MTAKQQQRMNRAVWFEIPASDFDRACRFYETLFSVNLRHETMGPMRLAVFPYEAPAVGGCVIQGDGNHPGKDGSIVYLNADPQLDAVLARVESAGGKIVQPRTALPEGMGFFAKIIDTENNTVGLHAIN
ncbi:MAG TPA: VOC family protein [Terriglobales bacterium]|nr:VOC family protein [Terriglobales bacterium]